MTGDGNSGESPQAEAMLVALRMFASGRGGPPDLALVHFSTSMHITTFTQARLDGTVTMGSVMGDRPRTRAQVGVEEVRAAAAAIVASGFPRVTPPLGMPPPPTVPPVRLGVSRGDTSLYAHLPASQVHEVPGFAAAVGAVAALGTAVRAGAAAATAALRQLADGETPANLSVEITFVVDATRSFGLTLNRNNIAQTERRGARERKVVLGTATVDEKKALARAFVAANFPEAHGKTTPIAGPHYLVRVVFGDASIEVIVDAEQVDERNLGQAIRGLYAAASRFGVRPLELTEDASEPAELSEMSELSLQSAHTMAPPVRPPPQVRPSSPMVAAPPVVAPVAPPAAAPAAPPAAAPVIAPELLELVNKQRSFASVARWLAEHTALRLAASPVEGGGHMPHIANENGVSVLRVFTSDAALDAWLARARIERPTIMRGTWGAGLFGRMPDSIGRVDVDGASPITVQIHGDPLATLRAVARAVMVERALGALADPASAQSILDHGYRFASRHDGPKNAQGVQNALFLSVPGPRGEALAAVFTADDGAEAFVAASGGPNAAITVATITGRDLIASLAMLGVEGISVNPAGPGPRFILPRETCAALLR